MSNRNNAKMTITLSESNSDATVSIRHPNGRTSQKCVSAEDLASALARQHTMSTGIVPSGTRFFKGDRNNYIITIESPAKVRRFLVHSNTRSYEQGEAYRPREVNIPYPNCLFTFAISRRRVQSTWVHSTPNKLGSETDTLYRFPFGNTYEDGHVCWGRVDLPAITSPMMLVGVIASFYDAPFNGDLTDRVTFNRPEDGVRNFWELVSYLEDKTSFESSWLRSMSTTFQQFTNNCNTY
ncbi:MAG: hypothetical protein ACWGQW_03750 [bacterium]